MKLVVLMIEVEQPEGLSARKLVLESAKHNVLTAYDGRHGLELIRRFPNVDLVVVHRFVTGMPPQELIRQVKAIDPKMPVVLLSPVEDSERLGAQYVISSHEPQMMLTLLEESFGASGTNY
ncbi:response regulator [Alloacidobacterium dinghuense]|uniref:Response regulator n=1 Tax=Alloacidobacterium dinghuense TaxID=2763107 RepID=A0A7G8BIM5_9BACT|nr:response regulator [Alloacidobacterium dinghuense]QNI32395.1 response regulator [Alloacidobacterium dinghuense]